MPSRSSSGSRLWDRLNKRVTAMGQGSMTATADTVQAHADASSSNRNNLIFIFSRTFGLIFGAVSDVKCGWLGHA